MISVLWFVSLVSSLITFNEVKITNLESGIENTLKYPNTLSTPFSLKQSKRINISFQMALSETVDQLSLYLTNPNLHYFKAYPLDYKNGMYEASIVLFRNNFNSLLQSP